jgi:hypothetical protein
MTETIMALITSMRMTNMRMTTISRMTMTMTMTTDTRMDMLTPYPLRASTCEWALPWPSTWSSWSSREDSDFYRTPLP